VTRLLVGLAGLAVGLLGGVAIVAQLVVWREEQVKWYSATGEGERR
jgi:hypothetical protein